jgi:hypothetical protein
MPSHFREWEGARGRTTGRELRLARARVYFMGEARVSREARVYFAGGARVYFAGEASRSVAAARAAVMTVRTGTWWRVAAAAQASNSGLI